MDQRDNRAGGVTEIMSNRPLVLGLLYLGSYFAPFLLLIALPLAYVFRSRPDEDWENSHFQYLIRTFWIAVLIALVAGSIAVALFASLGESDEFSMAMVVTVLAAAGLILALCGVRTIISLMKSSSRIPIDNPKSWLI